MTAGETVLRETPGSEPRLRALGVARILFGALVLCRTTPLLAGWRVPYLASTAPLYGWPVEGWHVAAFGLALPSSVVVVLCVARTVAAALFTAGVRARECGVAGAVLGWVVLSQDAAAYINTLHLLYLGMAVLAVGGAGSALALRPEREIDPVSGRALAQALVVSVYAWSGLAKLNGSWLSGAALAQFHEGGLLGGALADAVLASRAHCVAAAWVLAITEMAIGPLLLWPRSRKAAIAAALAFHAALEHAVHPDFFGFAMAVLLLSFAGAPAAQRQPLTQAA